ncbi:uncharacterized protein C8A04DRAFT_34037 [Dichotomopilus funicola]|uniref:Uncharacterized protein n=1 Tax=Dichotomopilus funicola TaxID=1934379 RepID=A0AAN6VB38_9PEZI|nr:hypothetical protein C8A04DRAFT_34037 [Dichotomopilus funicola]
MGQSPSPVPPSPQESTPTQRTELPSEPLKQVSLAELAGEHRRLLVRALGRILSTEIAEVTYAQIVDGLPIANVIWDSRVPPYGGHPILNDGVHEDICPGILEKTRELRDSFDLGTLVFEAKLHHGYRICSPGSRGFKIRFLEMVAVAVHQIAAILFDLDISIHKNDGIANWAPPKSNERYWGFYPDGPPPTIFRHPWYTNHKQYPRGAADMAGYWAESRIFGGVVLFDRRNPDVESGVDPEAVYFHPDRKDQTYRIVQLLPKQRQALFDFCLGDTPPPLDISLPILIDRNNLVRVDPEELTRTTGIYRDLWDRRELDDDEWDIRLKDVWNHKDYPTLDDLSASRSRASDRKSALRSPDYRRNGSPPSNPWDEF